MLSGGQCAIQVISVDFLERADVGFTVLEDHVGVSSHGFVEPSLGF